LPSGPAVIPASELPALMPAENSVTVPVGVIRPIRLPMPNAVTSMNQRLPAGPAGIPGGPVWGVMPAARAVSVTVGVGRPRGRAGWAGGWANGGLPGGPAVIPDSLVPAENSVTAAVDWSA